MEDVGHSPLLKFLVSGGDSKMSEPSNIESEVPGEQKLREGGSSGDNESSTLNTSDKAQSSLQANTAEVATADDFSLEPVITVTKQESTFTKGELKLQKVTVTEDISTSEETKTAGAINRRLTYEIHTKIPAPTNATNSKRDDTPIMTQEAEKENVESRRGKTRIPMARFRQAVDKVKREQKEMKKTETERESTSTHRKSSIPRLKDSKIQHSTKEVNVSKEDDHSSFSHVNVTDEDEFDNLFREIREKESFGQVSISSEECVSQVESNFDKIINSYEEDIQENVQKVGVDRMKQSRIPMLKRKSEHDIERPRSRERYTLKKSLSVDMDKVDSPAMQTEYTTETTTTKEIQGYAETTTESITFRSEMSYSNDYDPKKRQGITCDENVYNRILITDENFENAEERYRNSKYKQGKSDMNNTEAVPIIDEPEDSVQVRDVTEIYDDITVTSETQLTKISSEQVLFDKQMVSKIYKIDFTENTFELADSETTEVSNGHTEQMMKEKTSYETITGSTIKDSSISTFVDDRKIEDVVGDKGSRYKTISNEITRDYKDKLDVGTRSYSTECSINNEGIIQREILTKVDTKHTIETSGSVKDYAVNEVKDQIDTTINITNSIRKDSSIEIKDTKKSIKNSVTTSSTSEIKEIEVNVGNLTTKDSTVNKNDTDKTVNYLSAKQSYKEIKNTASVTENRINEKKDTEKNTSTNEIKDAADHTNHLLFKYNLRKIKETDNISDELITKVVKKETEDKANKELDSITKGFTRENEDIGITASQLVRNVSKEDTQENEKNKMKETKATIQDIKEINSVTNRASGLYVRKETEDAVKKIDSNQSIKETEVTSSYASDEKELNLLSKVTKNRYSFDGQTISQSATINSSEDSNGTFKRSHSHFIDKPLKPEVNGNKSDYDAETYKIYSDVFSKISGASKVSSEIEIKTEKSQKNEESSTQIADRSRNSSLPENTTETEENTLSLRGKVSRIVSRISSNNNSKTEDRELLKDVPKKKSILSKIALFERDEPYESIPKPKAPQPEPKPLRGLAALRQTSKELRKPKIVNEIYKGYNERGANLLSEKDGEEIAIKIKDVKKETEVNRFDTTSKTKLNDHKTVKANSSDIPKTPTEVGNKEKEDENGQEEITIHIKNVTNEANLHRSDSTFKSNLYHYKKLKDDNLELAKTERFYSQEEKRTEENDVKKLTAANSNTSNVLGINESQAKGNIQVEADEKVFTIHYESSFKINSATSSSANDSYEESNKPTHTNLSPSDLVDEKFEISKETNNTHKISDNRKIDELDKHKKNNSSEILNNEEYKDKRSDKMVKRMRSRDPILQRAISVVEDDLGDVIKGKVKGIISRINSMEQIELTRKRNEDSRPPRGSVLERIALFEGKASSTKAGKSAEGRSWRNRSAETRPKEMDDETCAKRMEELKEAKKVYGLTNTTFMELRDGTKMPVIALGTALLDKRLVRQVVETAIDLGYRAIDTAFIYGNEKEIGEGINAKINDGTVKRDDLYIISKLWSTFHRRDLVERACKSSLETMGLTYFDLYLIHNPMSFKEGGDPIPKIANVVQFSEHNFMDAWYGIEDLVAKGLVKSAGLSNFNSEQVHRVTEKGRLKPVVNQVECHPYLSQDRLAGFCDAYGIKLVCFGALGSKGTPKALKSSQQPAIEDPLVQVMAAGLSISPAQLLLAFQVMKGRGVVAKASSAAHLHENLLAQQLQLASGKLTALAALDRHKRTYTFEGMGETHKNYPFKIAF